MATGTLVSVEEYLNTSYEPDRDYVEGELIERNMGEKSHGRLQLAIGAWIRARESSLRCQAVTEVRLQIDPKRYRIPDVMVLSADAPDEEIIRTAPLLCVEILSRRDTLESIWDRIEEYFSIGVPVCWVVDPRQRRAWIATPEGRLSKVTDGTLRAGEIELPMVEVFDRL